jgi:cytochrome c biogenesis protein CcmG, thiol:disulfide interchange protein DsbE
VTDSQLNADIRKRSNRARFVVAVVLVVMVGIVVVLATRPSSNSQKGESPLVGKEAPAVEGETIDGERVALSDYRGKWVLVNVFATWCIPCLEEHPDLVRFAENSTDEVQVFGVIFKDQAESVRQFRKKNGGNWPMVTDDDGSAAVDLGIRGVPESFLISPDGVIRAKIIGGVTVAKLEGVLARSKGEANSM